MLYNRVLRFIISIHYFLAFSLAGSLSYSQSCFHGEEISEDTGYANLVWWDKREYRYVPGILRIPTERQLQHLSVQWNEPKIDALERFCTLSGTLSTPNPEGNLAPIHWQQMIGVHLAIRAGATPDWSQGTDYRTAMGEAVLVNEDGTFAAKFDLWYCETRLDDLRDFQVGISLAKQTLTEQGTLSIDYRSSAPVLEQSLSLLTIPTPAQLPPLVRAIAQISNFPSDGADSVDLIRVANALRLLGKEEALKVMEQYQELSRVENAYYQTRVIYALCICLFEPVDPDGKLTEWRSMPTFIHSPFQKQNYPNLRSDWPRLPIEIYENCPWVYDDSSPLSEVDDRLLDWFRENTVLREAPLKPVDNPFETIAQLIEEPRFKRLDERERSIASDCLKKQAHSMVRYLFPPYLVEDLSDEEAEAIWNQLRTQAKVSGLHWNDDTQSYALRKPITVK